MCDLIKIEIYMELSFVATHLTFKFQFAVQSGSVFTYLLLLKQRNCHRSNVSIILSINLLLPIDEKFEYFNKKFQLF